MSVVAVIPAYNEAATLSDVVARTLVHCPVVVVDDGSSDGTAERLDGLPVQVLRNPVNSGKAITLWRGFQQALSEGAEWVVTLDGDGQHRPEDLPQLLGCAAAHPEAIVIGARLKQREKMPGLRRFGNRQANFWISWAAGQPILDSQSGFRVYPASLLRQLGGQQLDRRSGFVFESEVLIEASWCGVPIHFEQIAAHYPRSARTSHYRPTADTLAIISMVAARLLRRGLYPQGLLRSLRTASLGGSSGHKGEGV